MAWTTCKTDWTDGDLMTYSEMNRIAANINYLLDASTLKDDWAQNDFMLKADWDSMVDALNGLCEWCNMENYMLTAPDCLTSIGVNQVEELAQNLYDYVTLKRGQGAANRYSGDGAIAGEYIYSGGI